MIQNRFLFFQTLNRFQSKLELGEISSTSIAFIADKKLIWNHGIFYGVTDEEKTELQSVIAELQSVIAKLNESANNLKPILITQEDYDNLSEIEKDRTYYIVDGYTNNTWTFGGTFPIQFGAASSLGTFPITLK